MIDSCAIHQHIHENVPATRVVTWHEVESPMVLACDSCALQLAGLEVNNYTNIMIIPLDDNVLFEETAA